MQRAVAKPALPVVTVKMSDGDGNLSESWEHALQSTGKRREGVHEIRHHPQNLSQDRERQFREDLMGATPLEAASGGDRHPSVALKQVATAYETFDSERTGKVAIVWDGA